MSNQPLTTLPDMHRRPLLRHLVHPLLGQPAPLPRLHSRRLSAPHRRHRRRRHSRQAAFLSQLPRSRQRDLRRQHCCFSV
jgi:hypothetical protein